MGEQVALSDIISLFVNNGVAVAVIIYFMIRDYKFITGLSKSIQELIDSVKSFEKTIKGRSEK